jgi:hypothetical protein
MNVTVTPVLMESAKNLSTAFHATPVTRVMKVCFKFFLIWFENIYLDLWVYSKGWPWTP